MESSAKRPRTSQCVICGLAAADASLKKPKTLESWMKLLQAAELHKHDTILQYVGYDGIPDVLYHKDCKRTFTHKKTIAKLKKLPPTCIFCENTKGSLSDAVDLTTDDTLRNTALEKNDVHMLAITSRKLVTVGAHYHSACYSDYIRSTTATSGDDQLSYAAAEQKAYSMLFNFVRSDLFQRPRIETLDRMTEKLMSFMKQMGYEEFKTRTKRHLRSKLEEEFGDSINIISTDDGKFVIVPNSLSKEMLIKENLKLSSELESRTLESRDKVLVQCALNLRTAIQNSDVDRPWLPQPENLDNDYIPLPGVVKYFLKVLLTGDIKDVSVPSRVERLIQSLGQDYIYALTAGKQKPAKHILLSWTVKSLTGSVELIKIINRLGHGISHGQLEEIDMAHCLQNLADEDKNGVPPNILPDIPTCLAYDNIDRVEAGVGATHMVNGIVIQPRVPTAVLPKFATRLQKRDPPLLYLPPYNAGVRVGPPVIIPSEVDYDEVERDAQMKNHAWAFIRLVDVQQQTVASWTGFNIQTRNDVDVTEDVIGYLPTINAPATELSTVYEILVRILQIMEKLHLQEISCVFDQALYARATEIAWKDAERFRPIVLRMGVFHTICNMLSIIGKRFQDAGLRDLAVESGIVPEGFVTSTLEGRKYNRAVRLHKVIYEALLRLAWKGFSVWIEEHHAADLTKFNDTAVESKELHHDINQDRFTRFLGCPSNVRVLELFCQYLDFLRTANGNLSEFWMSYVDMVEIVLGLIRASREGNWFLHLAMIRRMIPWTFAYDKQNYAKYLSVYYSQMTRLEEQHPQVYEHFINGGFAVQIDPKNPFGRIPIDQTIEETANKDTRRLTTVACVRQIRQMLQMQPSGAPYTELEPSVILRDEGEVQTVMSIFGSSWINPFGDSHELVCISTGSAAPTDVCEDLLLAKLQGDRAYVDFKIGQLEGRGFYDRLSKQNLKTFSSIGKCKHTRITNKEIVLKADHRLFAHIVLAASKRSLDMRKVLQHPLGPLPWSLANVDGTMRKTNKASLARNLEKRVQSADTIPRPSACIIDGMVLVHRADGEKKKYAELAAIIFDCAMREGAESDRIDLVFDVYRNMSIKNAEREKRNPQSAVAFRGDIVPGHRIRQWRSMLANSNNKTAIIRFLFTEWQQVKYMKKLGKKTMFLTCGKDCVRLDRKNITHISQLRSSHEEADTRLFLHAEHALPNHQAIVIVSEDTDVFVLAVAFHRQIPRMFIKCGTSARTRYIDVDSLATVLGKKMCDGLLGLHAYTGCDTVSAFGGRGKMGAFNLMVKDKSLRKAMVELGKEWRVTDKLFTSLQRFTCKMYAAHTTIGEVNELRYQLFRSQRGNVESSLLPPCEDCLRLHCLRANYQAAIWRRSLECNPDVPPPDAGHGWFVEDGQLSIEWMRVPPAPETVLELLACKCKKSCKLPKCQCLANGLKCTPACKLQTCENFEDGVDLHATSEDNDDDDEDDVVYSLPCNF